MVNMKKGSFSAQSFGRKVIQIMLVAGLILIAFGLVMMGVLLAWSPGKMRPLVDANGNSIPGSISEKIFVNINGVEQGMIIQSVDPSNPVLLFLHGGPGMPEYFLTEQYPTGLEDHFTVVWWDQRGAGLSFTNDMSSVTIDQIIDDTLAVTNYLRGRFGKEKIYLMGHSGGSFFGIQAAARAPELYYAYIGLGQLSYQLKSETLAYPYMLEQFKQIGNMKMVQKLEAAAPTLDGPLPAEYAAVRDEAMHSLGIGTTRDMESVVSGLFFPSLRFNEYTLSEKINLWRGKINSSRHLRNTIFAIDLTQQVTQLDLPVYFFHGKYDFTCSYSLAKSFLEGIEAPVKGFYTFEQSAHSPIFEEPEKVNQILLEDVLNGETNLADSE